MTKNPVGVIFREVPGFEDQYVTAISVANHRNRVQIVISSNHDAESQKFDTIVSRDDLQEGAIDSQLVFPATEVATVDLGLLSKSIAVMNEQKKAELLRNIAFANTQTYFEVIHEPKQKAVFVAGKSRVPYAGRVFDSSEMINLVDSSLEFWLTTGRYAEEFESEFAKFIGVKKALLVNSGSSANLVAFSTLTSPQLGDRQIKKGDEVIGVAAGFPTTINPILQYGAVPVFVDIDIRTHNIDTAQLESALTNKTKAIMLAHTLGNPFDLETVKKFCEKNNLWLIEDNCDALGSRYFMNNEWVMTGSVGDIGTSSFYPPHHMTMGEGGAVYMNSPKLKKIAESYRDWGRDCWCPSGRDDTCGKRFNWTLGELPKGYDHKYIYSHLGYNLKVTDMQAAIGVAQLKKLPGFVDARKKNWKSFYESLADLEDFFILPQATNNSDPSWFGFILTIKENVKFSRQELISYLENHNIQTRMLFAGNYLRHPVFDQIRGTGAFRIAQELKNTDEAMNRSFWLGVYPGMKTEMVDFVSQKIREFCKR